MKLSFIIISYKSDHLLNNLLNKISKKHEVIVIENSLQKKTKHKIEKKFKNSKVIIPSKNLGYASAFNKAFKLSKNNFLITLTPDVVINKKLILQIEILIHRFKNFHLMAPEYRNQKIYRNFTPISNSKSMFKIYRHEIIAVKEIDWCFCILNKKKFKSSQILDENFFLYFETMDLCKRLYKNKKKMYVIKNLKFHHLGTSSSNKKYNFEIKINRNWHFSWSKFYFYKKNYSYLFALKKILPNVYQSLVGVIWCILVFEFKDIKLHIASLKGLLSGIFLIKSHFRPNLN